MHVKPIAGILIVFICGITIGFIICHHLIMSRMHHARSGGPKVFHEHIIQKLNRELSLKEEQKTSIKKIVETTLKTVEDYHTNSVKVKMDSIFDDAKKKIASNLDDKQKKQFESMPPLFGPKGPRHGHRPPHDHRGGFPPPPPPRHHSSAQSN